MRALNHGTVKSGTTSTAIRRHLQLGGALCVLLIVGVGGWAATATLAGAIIAPASVVVETDVKKVQHQAGGIVAELNVKDGDRAAPVMLHSHHL